MKRLFSIKEFCAAYSVSRTRCYELLAQGELTALKHGPITLITADSAERWLSSLEPFESQKTFVRGRPLGASARSNHAQSREADPQTHSSEADGDQQKGTRRGS